MINDYLNKKLKTKTQDVIATELDSLQKENDMLIETLRNFKDTHNEMTVIIEEVMKI